MTEEELKLYQELYHRVVADFATDFAIDATNTLVPDLPPPSDVVILNILDELYPNDYSTVLIPALQTKEYKPTLHNIEINKNGTLSPKNFPPQSVIKGKPVIYVGVHFSPLVGLYLSYALERGASRAIYASPIPPPSALWEYVEGRVVQMKKSGV